ncbi:MAG: condensation domain-containing protein [Clostridia bacterium]|nr:condensation domain-containing protein [Clostridia bacterium]
MSILINELCSLYNDEQLPNLKISYKDFSVWEKKELESEKLQQAKQYWLNKFEGEIPVLNMPCNHSRPAVKCFEGKKVYGNIDNKLTKQINNISQQLGVTPYMLLLSVYYVLLSKYTGQEDIVVGSPIIGRDLSAISNVIGMFVNTLALRNTVNNKLCFKDFLNLIKENCLESYKYQTYPFDELINTLNIKRDTSRNPLFDTMFVYQNNGNPEISLNGINAKYYIPDSKISKFDLSLEIIPNKEILDFSFEYCTKLFDKDFIERLSTHYINILKVVLENINVEICNICMLSEDEKNKILYEFNDTKMNYPKDKTISQLFEEQVEKTPDNIAVVFEEQKLTYKELNEKANSLANYLRDKGIGRNDIVGIMVNRSLEMIVGIMAVLKSGGCYIPIDPAYPQDRIEYMLKNSQAKFVLTKQYLNDNISFDNIINIELDNNTIYNLSNKNSKNINTPDDASYIIYTSGSTGVPKGVTLKHKAITNLATYLNKYVTFLSNPANQTIASVTTVSFDIFIFETLICLQRGLKVILANEEEQHIPSKLNELVDKNHVTIIQMTPSRIQLFLDNIEDFPSISNLEYVVLAGEPLPDKLLSDLLRLGIKKIYNRIWS